MKDSAKYNLATLAALVLLTTASGLVAFGQNGGTALALLLGFAACAKVLLVVWQFMEMKRAHRAWGVLVALILAIYLGLVGAFFWK